MRHIQIILIVLLSYSISSCTKKQDSTSDFIPPLKIEITNTLKEDAGITKTISKTEESINEFSDNIELIALERKKLLDKGNGDSSSPKRIEEIKLMLSFYSNNTQLQKTVEDFDKYISELSSNYDITKEQLIELNLISSEFKHRIDLLELKYPDFYKY